jgi:predicted O-methyltransferase YrrM
MALATQAREILNAILGRANLRLETLAQETAEKSRLLELENRDHFQRPIFPVPSAFDTEKALMLLKSLADYSERFASFEDRATNEVGYSFENDFYTTPDAEILYALVRQLKPKRIVEVGSGNSTKLFRQAIRDSQLETELVSVDPEPRIEIGGFSDRFYRQRVESLPVDFFRQLGDGDFLFIDSSHEIKPGNDVVFLFLIVLPILARGVVIHVHDIFLPYEYPRDWLVNKRWGWNEQYLVQSLLEAPSAYEVLWAGHYLQRTMSDFQGQFPNWRPNSRAGSLWLQRCEAPTEAGNMVSQPVP